MTNTFQLLCATTGRVMLGLYFLLPGAVLKIFNMEGTAQAMTDKGMVAVSFFLILTILIQLVGGINMIVGYQVKITAFLLAGLTLMINLVMHNFWEVPSETQNFVKNLGILAGLLVSAGLGAGAWSLDHRLGKAVPIPG
ncbi:MAG: DoxX family protein [Gammaproteobacteria bacterium]